jgi:hypothetical protein
MPAQQEHHIRACANRRATFRTWHLSEGLNSLLTTAWHIRYSPIGAASKPRKYFLESSTSAFTLSRKLGKALILPSHQTDIRWPSRASSARTPMPSESRGSGL